MNIYLCERKDNSGYDTYDSFVCAASSESEARNMQPCDACEWGEKYPSWCETPEMVSVSFIGVANDQQQKGVILSSYIAG